MAKLKQKIRQLLSGVVNQQGADKKLITVVFAILIFGLISLSSSSSVIAYANFGDAYYYFKHQLVGLSLGLMAFWFFARIDYHVWKKYAFGFLIFSIFLLLLVFIPGIAAEHGTARSWINVFGHSLQPSEIVKLSFLLYLAAWLEARKDKLDDFSQGIGPFLVILGVVTFLMIKQPDIGTLSIIAVTSLFVYFIGGGKIKHIVAILVFAILSFSLMIQFKPYQLNRFRCLLDPNYSKQDICYQINQSLIAVGSGGILGRGLGESRQKYMYLPGVKDDFIFAVIAEEMGLIIGVAFLLCYLYLFYRGYIVAQNAPDDFGKLLSIGIVSWISVQAIINIGGIVNVFPMTGVPLPLVSYGGSAILAALSACGILVNISKQTKIK